MHKGAEVVPKFENQPCIHSRTLHMVSTAAGHARVWEAEEDLSNGDHESTHDTTTRSGARCSECEDDGVRYS